MSIKLVVERVLRWHGIHEIGERLPVHLSCPSYLVDEMCHAMIDDLLLNRLRGDNFVGLRVASFPDPFLHIAERAYQQFIHERAVWTLADLASKDESRLVYLENGFSEMSRCACLFPVIFNPRYQAVAVVRLKARLLCAFGDFFDLSFRQPWPNEGIRSLAADSSM